WTSSSRPSSATRHCGVAIGANALRPWGRDGVAFLAMTERGAGGINAEGLHDSNRPLPNRAFQALLDAVPGAWFLTRQDATFAYVNVGACQGLGYTREELLRRTIFDVDPTMTKELWAGLWATTASGDSRTIRVRHRRKDGSAFPVEVRAA